MRAAKLTVTSPKVTTGWSSVVAERRVRARKRAGSPALAEGLVK